MNLATILNIISLFNAVEPNSAQLILLIRNADGTLSVPVILDQADAKFNDNLKQATDWLKTHSAA